MARARTPARAEMESASGLKVFSDRHVGALGSFQWNPSMDLLATVSTGHDSLLSVWRLLSEEASKKLFSEKTPDGVCLRWSPQGRTLAVGDESGRIYVLEVAESGRRPSGAACANGAVDMEHGLEIENVGRRGPLSTAVT